MRVINKIITINKYVATQETVTSEEIIKIEENKLDKLILVTTILKNSSNELLKIETCEIRSDKYDLLMSANPSFALQKPENEYRESDLWYIIDLIRQENASE